jgi:hypothetical protein
MWRGRLSRLFRIAFTAMCGIACLLMVALWVRSYSNKEQLIGPISQKHSMIVESASGRVIVVFLPRGLWGAYWDDRGPLHGWKDATREMELAGFAYATSPWHRAFRLPHWFLVL